MEIEIIGADGGGFEDGDRLAPHIAVGASRSEIMPAGEPREIGRGDHAAADDIFEVAGELRPEGRFERDILAYRDDPEFGERCLDVGDIGADLGLARAMDGDRHMMFAESGAARGDIVLGARKLVAQAERFILGRAHAAQREVHLAERGLAVNEGEALRHHHLERQAQQFVEHAGRGRRRIILDRDHAGEARRGIRNGGEFDRLGAEADPPVGQIVARVLMRREQLARLARIELAEKFERFGAQPLVGIVEAEKLGLVAAELRDQRLARRVEHAQFLCHGRPIILPRLAEPARQTVEQPHPPRRGTADEGEVKVVAVELLRREPRMPSFVEPGGEVVAEFAVQFDARLAPHDMMIEGIARRADRLQHRVAQQLAVIELVAVGGFEQDAAQADHLHQQPVARLDRMIVDVARIGQMLARRHLAVTRRRAGLQGR